MLRIADDMLRRVLKEDWCFAAAWKDGFPYPCVSG